MTNLDGRTALVNGGGTGIEPAIAITLASRGARVGSEVRALTFLIFPETDWTRTEADCAQNELFLDLLAEDSWLISNDVGNVKTHLVRSGRRSRLS